MKCKFLLLMCATAMLASCADPKIDDTMNIDGSVSSQLLAQKPKMAPHIPTMRENIARTLQTDTENISVKATTTEKLGFVGRSEGCEVYAVALLKKMQNTNHQ